MPFFKQLENGELYETANVYARDYTLTEDSKDAHEYPLDGWVWAETQDEALALLAPKPDAVSAALKGWWGSLTVDQHVVIYKHAADALLAWERGDTEEMVALISTNEAPELLAIKQSLEPLLSQLGGAES